MDLSAGMEELWLCSDDYCEEIQATARHHMLVLEQNLS